MPKAQANRITIDAENCTGCLRCGLACSFFTCSEKTFNLSKSKITIVPSYDLSHFDITLSDACNHCGVCVKYCDFGVLKRRKGVNRV